jgi:hypothetical protein
MNRPKPTEYPSYYEQYISLVKGDNIIRSLEEQILTMQNILSEVPEEKENFTYAQGKWTMKEVIGHVIDTERIFAYRALRFARQDKTELPGFDQDQYVPAGNFNKRTLYDLAHEFGIVRESNLIMFRNFDEKGWSSSGSANGKEISVRAIAYAMAGHALHHMNVIRTKYVAEVV